MYRLFSFDGSPRCTLWDSRWTTRTIEQELLACEMESPTREMLLSFLPKDGRIVDAGCGFGKWVIYLKRQGYDVLGIDNSELAITNAGRLRQFP